MPSASVAASPPASDGCEEVKQPAAIPTAAVATVARAIVERVTVTVTFLIARPLFHPRYDRYHHSGSQL
jgi:hypothetical protein